MRGPYEGTIGNPWIMSSLHLAELILAHSGMELKPGQEGPRDYTRGHNGA